MTGYAAGTGRARRTVPAPVGTRPVSARADAVYQGTVTKVWFGWLFAYHVSIALPAFQL